MFYHKLEKVFATTVRVCTVVAVFILALVIFLIFRESLAIFQEVSVKEFLFGAEWRPVSHHPRIGLRPILAATLALPLVALVLALPLAVGAALFFAYLCPRPLRRPLRSLIDMMAGIPSVIYGMLGLVYLIPLMENLFSMSSGDSLLAGGVLLAIMVLPFMISVMAESMEAAGSHYLEVSKTLGVSHLYMLRELILPLSLKGMIAGAVLGTSRAMGETMAVMMVVGNSPLMPNSLLGRVKPIPSLIALEMGSAPLGSQHYHAIFGAGFVLLMLLLVINLLFYWLRRQIESRGESS